MCEAIAQSLEALSDLFDEELERQENALSICVSQGQAARAHDIEYLEARTEALSLLIQEAADAEKTRIELVRRIVAHYDLPPERQTLSELIRIAPDPWASRFRDFQARIASVLLNTRSVVRENNRLMRRSLRVVNEAMNVLAPVVNGAAGGYTVRGNPAGSGCAPVHGAVDARG
jgi:hypothetical protein